MCSRFTYTHSLELSFSFNIVKILKESCNFILFSPAEKKLNQSYESLDFSVSPALLCATWITKKIVKGLPGQNLEELWGALVCLVCLGIMTSVSVRGKHLLPWSVGWFCLGRPRGLAQSKVYLLGQALASSKVVTLGKMGRNEHQP